MIERTSLGGEVLVCCLKGPGEPLGTLEHGTEIGRGKFFLVLVES